MQLYRQAEHYPPRHSNGSTGPQSTGLLGGRWTRGNWGLSELSDLMSELSETICARRLG